MLDLKNLPKAPAVNAAPIAPGSLLSGLNQSQTFESGTYFSEPGTYNALIEKCIMKRSGKTGAPVYIMEFTIKDVLVAPPQIAIVKDGVSTMVDNPNAPKQGSRRTYVQKMVDVNVAFPMLKSFALAALAPKTPEERLAAEQQCEDALEAAADDRQLFKGTEIQINVVAKTTRAGVLIHLPVFKPAST